MKDLAEGGLPTSQTEVAVWYDEEQDVVVMQCDFIDMNFYSSDFSQLVDILNRARICLESGEED